ncbi:hypothetical protein AB4Y30_17470 [Ornithinibacillus sp. 4-3]|uniref:Glycoside hydrolase family 5 domain-containing protein n=1 Tax=Ornithinibacillus sp. 4-3 TaxID=3231488 RepID=A0AB39HQG1_9BACI
MKFLFLFGKIILLFFIPILFADGADGKLGAKNLSQIERFIAREGDVMREVPKDYPVLFKKNDHTKKGDDYHAGMNILIYGHPNIREAIDKFRYLQDLGVDSIAIVFPVFQEDWQANEILPDAELTPTVDELLLLIESAHQFGMRVMLRPILDEESIVKTGHWRGSIQPSNPDAWFESYRELMFTYAELGERTKLDVLNIGTELNSLERNYDKRWKKLIREIRNVYSGELTYSFNWNVIQYIPTSNFAKSLDFIGVDAYFPLNVADDASVDDLIVAWQAWIDRYQNIFKDQSIVLTEVGTLPIRGSHRTPYRWEYANGVADPQTQVNYYEATFRAWDKKVSGLYWWCITLDVNKVDLDYSPLDMPTEEVIKAHFLNSVQPN